MTREQHKINRLLRQVQTRLSKIETMMAEPVKDEPLKVDKIYVDVPKPIMVSEDGIELYQGDKFYIIDFLLLRTRQITWPL